MPDAESIMQQSKSTALSKIVSKGVGTVIALVQLFDIAIHAATNQLEPVRVAPNVVMLVWLAAMALGWFKEKLHFLQYLHSETGLLPWTQTFFSHPRPIALQASMQR